MTQQETPHRVERDSMGEVEVPRDALFGAQTRRALDNFPISDLRKPRRFVQALGAIKLEAANVNHELGLLDEGLRDAIVQAAEEVIEGELDEDRKSTRLNSSHANISYAVFCLKKKRTNARRMGGPRRG